MNEHEHHGTDPLAPIAHVRGEPLRELPVDLYIPPEALEVFLETFQGPLDLLLYLIRKQNLDILDIPVAEITRQYMTYIEVMLSLRMELAAEYLLMAAMLAEIKSRLLLPRPESAEQEELDPRAELVRRLQEYERFSAAAGNIDRLPRVGREVQLALVESNYRPIDRPPPKVSLTDLLDAFSEVLRRAQLYQHHRVKLEPLSVRDRMTAIVERIQRESFAPFESFFDLEEGRRGLVVTFLAILELLKEELIVVVQQEPYAPIHIKSAA